MSRKSRAETARHTLEILDSGRYTLSGGATVSIGAEVEACKAATRLYEPEELAGVVSSRRPAPHAARANLEVRNETTLAGISRMHAAGAGEIAALNFASARNPGGGFQSGSQAQEESLARCSALYASLMCVWSYYERHRQQKSLLYTDATIVSPRCPVFRNDDGLLLEHPQLVSFITCAAPNAGAVIANQPQDAPLIPQVFARRAEAVLALASAGSYPVLILGAWGCGVFRNDPAMVAQTFRDLLCGPADWARHFTQVVFSVFDPSPSQPVYRAFEKIIAG